jgi:IS66 Orf2 like protein
MILLSSAVRIYVAAEPVNMRRSFDGLMAQVRSVLAQDPLLCGGL